MWNSGPYDFAKILGHAECDGKFAYISGNNTNAYVAETVDYSKRSMLTVLKDGDVPALFFVYDDVTSKNENAIKKFLLHTVNEPTVEGNRITATNGDGKLTLTSLFGADKIEKIGGAGKGFWVGEDADHGYNVTDDVEEFGTDTLYGRVELSTTGNKTDKMLNVMYVTDADSTAYITPLLIETDKLAGAIMGDTVGVFMKSRSGEADEFSFSVGGDGMHDFYVCGVAGGSWTVSVNGEELCTLNTTDESGMLKFSANAGNITLSPKA